MSAEFLSNKIPRRGCSLRQYVIFFLTIPPKYGTLIRTLTYVDFYGGTVMVALIAGLLLLSFTVIAVHPAVLGWGPEIIMFLKGFAPFFAAFVGLIAVFIGVADIKDKNEAKKEEAASKRQDAKIE